MPKKAKSDPKKTKTPLRWLIPAVLVCVVAMFFLSLYITVFAKTDRPAKLLVVGKGDTYQSLFVKNHWQNKPLSLPILTRLYLKFHAKGTLEQGAYTIPANASLQEAVEILGKGAEVAMIKVQLIEGKTIKDLYYTLKNTDGVQLETLSPKSDGYTWQAVLADNAKVGQALKIDQQALGEKFNGNLEGLFAPNTYYFAKGTTDTAILKKLYDTQKTALDKAWAGRDKNLPYQSPYELLIMASIIEKETGLKDERNKVSAVFVNRLRQNMRLQTDPTIIYGLFDRYDGKIYRSNIDEKTDYNTYQIDGLPPTPIAMPSAEALMAAAHPENTDVIFFVATGKGGHKFSKTLDEHNQAVAEYRRVMADKKD